MAGPSPFREVLSGDSRVSGLCRFRRAYLFRGLNRRRVLQWPARCVLLFDLKRT